MRVAADVIQGFRRGWYIGYRLFAKSTRAEYIVLQFGFLWNFAEPISLAVIFLFLREGNVLSTGNLQYPFAIFLLTGLMPFQLLLTTLQRGVNCIREHADVLNQVAVPPEAIAISLYLRFLLDSCFISIVIAALTAIYAEFHVMGVILAFVWLQLAGLMFIGLGLLLAPFNSIYQDVTRMVGLVMRPLMFVSPVFFEIPRSSTLALVNQFNPIAHFLALYRNAVFSDASIQALHAVVVTGGALVALALGVGFFHVALPALNRK